MSPAVHLFQFPNHNSEVNYKLLNLGLDGGDDDFIMKFEMKKVVVHAISLWGWRSNPWNFPLQTQIDGKGWNWLEAKSRLIGSAATLHLSLNRDHQYKQLLVVKMSIRLKSKPGQSQSLFCFVSQSNQNHNHGTSYVSNVEGGLQWHFRIRMAFVPCKLA